MKPIRVLIAEDEVLIAHDIQSCLKRSGFQIAGVAYDRADALDIIKHKRVDIALLDINLEGQMEGIELAKYLNEEHGIPFVFLTSYSNPKVLNEAKMVNPMGYLVKPFKREDIVTSLNIALHNYNFFNKGFDWKKLESSLSFGVTFTPKEKDILEGIYEGKSNQQLSADQFVSPNTIKTHIKNIYIKLEVHNRSEAMVKIRELMTT